MSSKEATIPESPLVVGSVSSINQLACLQPVELPQLCDLLEIRLDGMAEHVDALMIELDRFTNFPLLITARRDSEGGLGGLDPLQRAELLLAVAQRATWVDVELASFSDMKDAIHKIRSMGVGLILSYHNFDSTPSERELRKLIDSGEEADIVKLALHHESVDDMARCTKVIEYCEHPLALMGMGKLAAVSRLLYAQYGSVLNYGYLGSVPTAPGQWPAQLLREGIKALLDGKSES